MMLTMLGAAAESMLSSSIGPSSGAKKPLLDDDLPPNHPLLDLVAAGSPGLDELRFIAADFSGMAGSACDVLL
eukprot:CAMPEP_0197681848 /NCGR_PEP_ID=MMETSP1338-20131121/95561_1 /TAXON_ID=43686 ORGANISM="Pelagodinium beii, Strain RCC1491" /NCGR_SAMPLE_ID=MMETSP1338 /ASSEMBLY_ACC=CAM_ASM_000754 /LENGTH=72 /DNA_ID=CAMNT_0043263239 /DNA_START=203 /DNA_END=421 /DNA_ORIENTATION=-